MMRSYDKDDCSFALAGDFPSSPGTNLAKEDGDDGFPEQDHQVVEHAGSQCSPFMEDHGQAVEEVGSEATEWAGDEEAEAT
jgi:hypothetical protein